MLQYITKKVRAKATEERIVITSHYEYKKI